MPDEEKTDDATQEGTTEKTEETKTSEHTGAGEAEQKTEAEVEEPPPQFAVSDEEKALIEARRQGLVEVKTPQAEEEPAEEPKRFLDANWTKTEDEVTADITSKTFKLLTQVEAAKTSLEEKALELIPDVNDETKQILREKIRGMEPQEVVGFEASTEGAETIANWVLGASIRGGKMRKTGPVKRMRSEPTTRDNSPIVEFANDSERDAVAKAVATYGFKESEALEIIRRG